jgi:transposase
MCRLAVTVKLSVKDKAVLESIVRAHKSSQRDVFRSRIVLLAAEGHSNRDIALVLGTSENTVGRWRVRYVEMGLDGLKDLPRSGAPCTYSEEDVLAVVRAATDPPLGRTHWSTRRLAYELKDRVGMSKSHIHRKLKNLDIKPHLCRS